MIAVSNAWKEANKKTLLPETFVEVTYTITEPGLQQEATASANYPESYSNVSQLTEIVDKECGAYTSLDYGAWGLDGGFSYFDGSPINPGYVDRNYSTSDGSMNVSPYPTITITLSDKHNILIPGLTITWSKTFSGWATSFRITAYDGSTVVAQKTVTGNTAISTKVWVDIVSYSKITIEVLKWSHPYQRVRCSDIKLGISKVYTKSDLLGFDHKQSVDLLSAVLPHSEISFGLRNDDDRWNPDNPTGEEKYLLEQQEVVIRYGMNIDDVTEWVKGGTFWLSEWETPNNGLQANFTARDAISFMSGKYTGTRSGSLYNIALAAFSDANLPVMNNGNVRYVIDDSLKNFTTDFSEDTEEYSVAEILQMVAHAGCCVFYQDRDGVVHIEPWSDVYSNYKIDPMISYSHPEYSVNKPLRTLNVEYGGEEPFGMTVAYVGEVQTVDNPLITNVNTARDVAINTYKVLSNRKIISGEFRADMSLDALDNITIDSKYASSIVCVTDITYSTTGGAFKGTYTGRVLSDTAITLVGGDEV